MSICISYLFATLICGLTKVFSLATRGDGKRKRTHHDDDEKGDSNIGIGVIFALASFQSTEALSTAHERDMATLRDTFADTGRIVGAATETAAAAMAILPSAAVENLLLLADTGGYERGGSLRTAPTAAVDVGGNGDANIRPPIRSHNAVKKMAVIQRPTTARAFFGAKQPNTIAKANTDAASVKTQPSSPVAAAAAVAAAATIQVTGGTTEMTNEIGGNNNNNNSKGKASSTSEEKENNNAVVVGHYYVGDLEGDEEESDDEQELERLRCEADQVRERQDRRDALLEAAHAGVEEAPKTQRQGAMDAFTRTTAPLHPKMGTANSATNNNVGTKKRRKTFREKTTMGSNGYLTTTTEVVWEDVNDDDDDNEGNDGNEGERGASSTTTKATTANHGGGSTASTTTRAPTTLSAGVAKKTTRGKKSSAAAASDLKQKDIMGFFAAKKK